MRQRQAVTRKKALAYRSADRAGKSRILTRLVELTGWHRDCARAALRAALTFEVVKPRVGAGADVRPGRDEVDSGEVLGGAAGAGRERRAPMLGVLVPLLRRDDELEITDAEAGLLVRMSAATIDRRLAPERAKLLSRGRSRTKPGTLLKSQIPIRTWADTKAASSKAQGLTFHPPRATAPLNR